MLRLNTGHTTRHNLTLTGTVWRWASLSVDVPTATATVVLACYPDLGTAQAPAGRAPLDRKTYRVTAAEFAALANAIDDADPEPISEVIYAHIRGVDPLFAGAEDV